MNWLWVALGGAAGAWLRYTVGAWFGQRFSQAIPWPTWIINVTGSFLLGFIIGCASILPEFLFNLLAIGFCGAFTTFSTFGIEALKLWLNKNYFNFLIYILISVIVTTAVAAIGLAAGKALL
ncbi:fluoride efflux transporter CrcB [Paenibacillus sp. SC116]|uniref:fluoride efflux transporter CrcB n=1 Tax=Paenibacillus sp. SC116 TaxID=2968986 RepID=UPI00215A1C39|nr:fluoride efflux transporter CrcB [Paenibacillus sp. SC116]MCR8845981.1 fluoride efflux transporter CrcB [Paenibacillus sp. SC116]